MADVDLIRKKLAFSETCVAELRTLACPERIGHDVREEREADAWLREAVRLAEGREDWRSWRSKSPVGWATEVAHHRHHPSRKRWAS